MKRRYEKPRITRTMLKSQIMKDTKLVNLFKGKIEGILKNKEMLKGNPYLLEVMLDLYPENKKKFSIFLRKNFLRLDAELKKEIIKQSRNKLVYSMLLINKPFEFLFEKETNPEVKQEIDKWFKGFFKFYPGLKRTVETRRESRKIKRRLEELDKKLNQEK